ncbi:MAG: sodium/proline symporter [Oscillospiraceae bacterium]|nr:sodium/proline symporter [Oscillospiraceae bacterium]
MSGMVYVLGAIAVYLIGMLLIGVAYSKNSSSEDFYLGGRRLGPVLTAMSTEASDMSAYLLMGVPGLAMFCGVAEASWTAIGLAVGTYLNWLIVARRLRRYSAATGSITVPEFLSRRFRDSSRVIETVGALVIIIFFVPYTASGFAACGKLFNSLFGFDYETAMLLSAAVIVAYCALGGFMAASVTSLIQSIVMTAALIIVLFFGAKTAGGWGAVLDNARSVPGYLSLAASTDILSASAGRYTPLMVVSTMAWGLGYFGMPHILLHFMAAREENELKISRRVGSIWCVVSLGVAVVIGLVGFGMARAGAVAMPASESEAENLIVRTAALIASNGAFAAIVAGLILAGILAATMSTADAQLLAAASGVTQNLLRDVCGVKLSEKKSMLVARLTVIGVAALGAIFASNPNSSIFRVVSFAWAGFGATFGPVMLFALFWKRCNRWGAMCGMVAGAVMIFVWKFLVAPLGGVFAIYELLPAFVISALVIVLVSLCTGKPDREICEEFDAVRG